MGMGTRALHDGGGAAEQVEASHALTRRLTPRRQGRPADSGSAAPSSPPRREAPRPRTWCPTCRALFRGDDLARCPRHGDELQPAELDPLVGTTLADRYAIEDVIGEGGLGRVYRARHARLARRYAIKVPFGDVAFDPTMSARFRREADITGRLDHPHVVAARDVGDTAAGLPYLVMDLAEGENLGDAIARGPLPGARAIEVLGELLTGLLHAHGHGVIHRDLKPDNVVLTERGAVIIDFGIAALRDDRARGRRRRRLTPAGALLGTPRYMAPEQACGQPVDARTDLFALGVILYEMLAGVPPFEGRALEIADQHRSCATPAIAERVPGLVVDDRLELLAHWMMARERLARPQHGGEVLDALRAIARPAPDGDGAFTLLG